MPGSLANLAADPFLAAANAGNSANVRGDPFMVDYAEPIQVLEVVMRCAESVPMPDRTDAKYLPVCVCQIKKKPSERVQSGPASNQSMTNPVWDCQGEMRGWEEGDTLTFTIQEDGSPNSRILAAQDLTYDQYKKNGFEWWLPLEVNKMKRYPEGWPYAALQIKVHFIQPVKLTPDDPFMSQQRITPKGTGPCNNYCLPFRMWCVRRIKVCGLCGWLYTKWCVMMSCLCCAMTCMEGCSLCGMCCRICTGQESFADWRRNAAERLGIPADEDADGDAADVACCCVPLRSAAFLVSLETCVVALMALFSPKFISTTLARYMGGYAMESRTVAGAVQLTGMVFGPIGLWGSWQLQSSLLSTYNYYQMVRLLGMLFMFYTDIPLMADCNLFRVDLKAATEKYGWNAAMYNVAMGNDCIAAQFDLGVGALCSFVIFLYLMFVTRWLVQTIEQTPRYLLALPRYNPSSAFTKHTRTQGRTKPPYGAVNGTNATLIQQGKLEALAGPPIMAGMPGYQY